MTIPHSPQHERQVNTHSNASPFTPACDAIIAELGGDAALVHGIVWRYCQMADGVCRASVRSIAGRLKLSENTVTKYLQQLTRAGYLQDLTPGVRYRPHLYRDTGKTAGSPQISSAALQDPDAGPQDLSTQDLGTSPQNLSISTQNLSISPQNLGLKKVLREKQEREKESTRASQSPELALFREAASFTPPRQVFEDVIAAVQAIGRRLGREPTPDDLKPYVKAWAGRGFKPGNLAWLFDWAVNGTIPEKRYTDGKQTLASNSEPARLPDPTPEQLAAYARAAEQRRQFNLP